MLQGLQGFLLVTKGKSVAFQHCDLLAEIQRLIGIIHHDGIKKDLP